MPARNSRPSAYSCIISSLSLSPKALAREVMLLNIQLMASEKIRVNIVSCQDRMTSHPRYTRMTNRCIA